MLAESAITEYTGSYATIDQVVKAVAATGSNVSRNTVIWNINELIKQNKAIRVGRGVYGFRYKPIYDPQLSEEAQRACRLIRKDFKYLTVTVTDTTSLSRFMNLQPFSNTIVIEVRKKAIEPVLVDLRRNGLDAVSKADLAIYEKYTNPAVSIVVCPELAANPSLIEKDGIKLANIEKMLVDLVCDERMYGQYQGEELANIYRGVTREYCINYSQMLKYASLRKRKQDVMDYLAESEEYREVRGLL